MAQGEGCLSSKQFEYNSTQKMDSDVSFSLMIKSKYWIINLLN